MSAGLIIFNMYSSSLVFISGCLIFMGMWLVEQGCSLVIEWQVGGMSSWIMSMSLVFDWMSVFFLGFVCLISGCIMKYSDYYLEGEEHYKRFVFIMIGFVVSMWLLIISPNLVSLLLGWDGLGLTSYLLVVFYQSENSCNAGMLTVLSNRIGDVTILLSIALMFGNGSWDFYEMSNKFSNWVLMLVMLSCFTKSAQMPFSAWLPAAMAAPTPVSALVHSSTLVTAGVYVLIRFSSVMSSCGLSIVMLSVASLTMMMAGVGAMLEMDMKKVVALSTLSQLGMMIMIISVEMKELAFFHLISHALFKSSLFMCAGFMIHSMSGSQDGRNMSGFAMSSPALSIVLSSGNLALCGFPFLTAFYSKDFAMEYLISNSLNFSVIMMSVVGVGLTVSYSLRLLYMSAVSVSVSNSVSGFSDMKLKMSQSVILLFGCSVVMGFFMYWVVVPMNGPVGLSDMGKNSLMVMMMISGVIMFMKMESSLQTKKFMKGLVNTMLTSMWFMPFLSTKLVSKGFVDLGFSMLKGMEGGWSEYYGALGGRSILVKVSSLMQMMQSCMVVSGYLLTSVLSVGVFFLVQWV
uniref:NADH-ubiquinone oxidoreductase chain 5 n=1 Tax=Gammarus pisinnus TaxID=1486748 RepID=A0A517LS63_9CRUS|nr:NADH dehydrogenase subunit 5 [Gammarus pisinnus]QDS78470.1 NADH dehydrogenase subunit 5 [Gammarus pisinnus]